MSELRVRPLKPITFILPVPLASALAVAYTSKDFYCFPLGAAVLSIVILGLLSKLWDVERLYHWKHVRKAQFITFAALVLSFALVFRTDKAGLFHEAFGTDVPPGVHNLVVDRYVHGLPGDKWALMRFDADQATMDHLWMRGDFSKDETFELCLWEKEGWKGLISQAFSNFWESGGATWKEIAPMTDPIYRRRSWKDRTATPSTWLLWDAATGRAYALYMWD